MMHLCGVLYHLGTSALELRGVHRLQLHSEVGIGIGCLDLFLCLVRGSKVPVLPSRYGWCDIGWSRWDIQIMAKQRRRTLGVLPKILGHHGMITT